MNRKIVITGIILILLAIILGAFGAHALKSVLTEEKLASFETGVRYQILHGIALLSIGLNAAQFKFSLEGWYRIIFIGIICFSLSIYLLALQDVFEIKLSFLGPVTPLGGTLLIIGWLILILKIVRNK
jgi:uncharacterized membrane protein YgdD (TMEM256/DUF423 family)